MKRASGETGPETVGHRKWTGRKEQDDRVVWFPGGRAASMQQGRSDDGRLWENAWSGLEIQSQEVGSEGTIEKEEVQGEILAYQEEHEREVKKLLRAGMVPARHGELMQWRWLQQKD